MQGQNQADLSKEAIRAMGEDELIEGAILAFDLDPLLRAPTLAFMRRRASALGMEDVFTDLIRQYEEAERKQDAKYTRAISRGNAPVDILRDGNGKAMITIDNFLRAMRGDAFFQDIRYNLLSGAPETMEDCKVRRWEDKDDARARGYIESVYGIHNVAKYADAMRQLFVERSYHPVRELIDGFVWDGQNRIEHFLHTWVKCEDSPYTRECSRLIFAGGIHRVYNPGCKFDDMVVLIGIRQGEGKSTLVRWLALDDRFFREVTEFDGQKGMEALDGAWICEVGELLALTRTKEQEAVKSYLTRQVDSYRRPYDTRISEHPRQCVFIGTTNKREFLTDMTGGRRFYPIIVGMTGYELFDQKEAAQHYIAQCWAEARHRMQDETDGLPPYANRDLIPDIRRVQAAAQEDDYRPGMIGRYLEGKNMVCGIELWREALGEERSPTKKDYSDIGILMQGFSPVWERGEREVVPRYGRQRVWKRATVTVSGADFVAVSEDEPGFDLPGGWKTTI